MTFKINKTKEIKNADGSRLVKFQVYKTDRAQITPLELNTLSNKIIGKSVEGTKFQITAHNEPIPQGNVAITALNPTGWRTLKQWGKELDYKDEDDYYDGHVRDETKFKKYYQAYITIIIPKKR